MVLLQHHFHRFGMRLRASGMNLEQEHWVGLSLGPVPNAPKHEAKSPCEAQTWMNVEVIVIMHTHCHPSMDQMNLLSKSLWARDANHAKEPGGNLTCLC